MPRKSRRNSLLRIDLFISRVRAAGKDYGAVKRLCEQEIRFLRTASFRAPIPHRDGGGYETRKGYADTTLRSTLTDYRNALRKALGESHPALPYILGKDGKHGWLRVPERIQNSVREAYDAQIVQQHHHLRELDVDEYLGTARLVLADHMMLGVDRRASVMRVACAIIAVTGRRRIEALKTGVFTPLGDDQMMFAGQAKTRGAKSAQTDPYPIPVLADPQLIADAVASVRARYDLSNYDNSTAKKRFNKTLADFCAREYHDEEGTPLTPSELRAAYAMIVNETRRPARMSRNAFTATTLGHGPSDLSTGLSYMVFRPKNAPADFDSKMREELARFRDGITAALEYETDETRIAQYKRDLQRVAELLKDE